MSNNEYNNSTGGIYVHQTGMEVCSPNHFFGPAIRTHYLLHIVKSGKGIFQSEGKTYFLEEGQGFIIEPKQSTYYKADLNTPWTYYWLGLDGREAIYIFSYLGVNKQNPIFQLSNIDEACDVINCIHMLPYQGKNQMLIQSYIYKFFSYVKGNEVKASHTSLGVEVAEYMHLNYSYPISIEELAHKLTIDRTQLFRLFKDEFGISPKEYLVNFRLKQAAYLLSSTSLSITEVMFSCGFTNLSYFSRQFQKKYKESPSKYRNLYYIN